ncbi:MAG: hypothetical protein AB8B53_09735 [Flavobacteriales bacterium]
MNSQEILSKIGENLDQLAAQRDHFKETVSKQNEEIQKLKAKVENLEHQLNQLPKEANNQLISTQNTSSNEGVKLKIDGLIEEIDECLTLLNN